MGMILWPGSGNVISGSVESKHEASRHEWAKFFSLNLFTSHLMFTILRKMRLWILFRSKLCIRLILLGILHDGWLSVKMIWK